MNDTPLKVLYNSERLRGLLRLYGTATQVLAKLSEAHLRGAHHLTDEEFDALLLMAERDQ